MKVTDMHIASAPTPPLIAANGLRAHAIIARER